MPIAVLTMSCNKEADAPTMAAQEELTMSFTLPDNPVTKTFLGERDGNVLPLLWGEGDVISINGTMSNPLSAEAAGKRSAPFTIRGTVQAPFNVLYPGTSEADKIVFPGVQKYKEGSFDPSSLPMYASAATYSDATMHHVGTLLGFPFKGAGHSLKQVIVMSMDGKEVSGTFTLEKDASGLFTGAISASEGASNVVLDLPDGGLPLSAEPVTLWISVPSGEYPNGFVALVVDTEDNAMTLSFLSKGTSSNTLYPGNAVLFPVTDYNPGAGLFLIDEPEDLIILAQDPKAHSEVLMVKDIDMSDVSDWAPVEGFNGLFNAAGHTISGLDKAVFGTLEGEIRNLVVNADIASSEAVTAGIVNEIAPGAKVTSSIINGRILYSGKSDKDVYLGGIAAKCYGNIVSSRAKVLLEVENAATYSSLYVGGIGGCWESDVPIDLSDMRAEEGTATTLSYPKTGAAQLRCGGLFGYMSAPEIRVKDCTNAADFTVTVASGAASSRIMAGGIIGHSYAEGAASMSFKNCSNAGSFVLEGKGGIGENNALTRTSCVGGIVGKCQIAGTDDSSEVVLEDCVNDGAITMDSVTGSTSIYGRITYLAGICGDVIAGHITDSGCVNNGDISVSGYTDRVAIAGHIGIVWRSEGERTVLNVTGKGSTPVNTGTLKYADGSQCMKHPAAGGIIGQLLGQEPCPLVFVIKDCSNSGKIDRTSPANATFSIASNNEATAGGIIGNIGFVVSTPNYSFVNGLVQNCDNTAQITINAFAGETVTLEKTTNQSFLGGIVGLSNARGGLVTVKDCSNSGYMQLTAGNAGGIVGRIQANTVVTGSKNDEGVVYTLNSGRVGEFDLSLPTSYVSTGYSITGGIVGAMIFDDADDVSKIEYCHNSGDVSGCHRKSDGAGTITRPTVGGIIGQYDPGRSYAAVRYCKNSGHVRSYRAASSSSTWQYSGIISGSYPEDESVSGRYAIVRDCGVGGTISRASWITPTAIDGDYPFCDYIYCFLVLKDNDKYPPTTPEGTGFAEGCLAWDGTSKLPWEE